MFIQLLVSFVDASRAERGKIYTFHACNALYVLWRCCINCRGYV